MPTKTNLSAEALAVRVIETAIQYDKDVWSACAHVEQRLAKNHVSIPFSLKQKACEIADEKLTMMDELETLNEIKKARIGSTMKKNKLKLSEQAAQDNPQQMADFQAPPQKPVSLDQVVDRYIVRYERESIPLEGQPNGPGVGPLPGSQPAGGSPSSMEESIMPLKGLLSFLLHEQVTPAEEEPPGEDTAPTDDASGSMDMPDGGDDPLGGGAGGLDEPMGDSPPPEGASPVVNTPQINLNEFSRSIARMVNNYDALLNPRTIILNRVEAYLKSNYNEGTAKHFMQIMERNYGLHVTSIEYPEDKNEFPTVYGVGAFAGGAGGGG